MLEVFPPSSISAHLTWHRLIRVHRLHSHMSTDVFMWASVCVCVYVCESLLSAHYLIPTRLSCKDHLSLHCQLFIHTPRCDLCFQCPVERGQKKSSIPTLHMVYSSMVLCLEFLTSTVFGHFCTLNTHLKAYESQMNCVAKLLNLHSNPRFCFRRNFTFSEPFSKTQSAWWYVVLLTNVFWKKFFCGFCLYNKSHSLIFWSFCLRVQIRFEATVCVHLL